jgi:hypothetical protein
LLYCGLDCSGEFGGGVPGDRDPDVQFGGEVVVPQFEVEGVVDPPLSIFRQPVEINVGPGDDVQQGKINGRPCLALPGKIGEEVLLPSLFREHRSEAGLDAGAPRLVEVVVSGGLEALQLSDEVVLALLEARDLRGERGGAACRAIVGDRFVDRSGQEEFAAVAEDALLEEPPQWRGELVLADDDVRRVGVVPR